MEEKIEFDYNCFSHKARADEHRKTYASYDRFIDLVKNDRSRDSINDLYTIAVRNSTTTSAIEIFYKDGQCSLEDVLEGIKGCKSTQCVPFEDLREQLNIIVFDLEATKINSQIELRDRIPGTYFGIEYILAILKGLD